MRFFKRFSIICIVLFCTFQKTFGQVTIAGANPLTPNGVFPNLGSAFAAINASGQAGFNVVVTITANIAEPATAGLNQNAGPWNSLLIQTAGAFTVSGNISGPLIDINGADNITINGANILIFDNTNAGNLATTIRFINDAQNNTLTNCIVKGSGTGIPTTAGDGAVVFISGTGVPSATGNDNITISNNDLTASSTIPFVIIKGYGSLAAGNNDITISNNLIHDFFSTVNSYCRGIYVGNGNSTWTMSGNRIYQTSDRQWITGSATNVYSCIDIQNSTFGNGNNFIVSGNILGFRNSAGTGYSVLKNGGTSATNIASNIHAIIFNASGSVNNVISNNLIGGFDLKSSRATNTPGENIFIGIFIRLGAANVTDNQIGSSSASNSIIIRSTATTAPAPVPAAGIYARGTNAVNITGNRVGGFTMTFETPGTGGSDKISFIGIFSDNSSTITIRNNFIGGLNSSNTVMPYANARLVGIQSTGGGISKITGNKIQNLVHTGIRITFNGQNSNIVGILVTPGAAGDSIARDTITNLSSTATTASGNKSIVGIYADANPALPGTEINKNIMHSFSAAGGPGYLTGITTTTGRLRISNNMISIGYGLTSNDIIFGIEQIGATNVEAYFNTIKVSGTATGAATSAYRTNCSSLLPGTLVLKNNIIYNDRSGASYALNISLFTTYTSDHNLVYGTRFGVYQGTAYLTYAPWFGATGQDDPANTKNSTMTFISGTDLHTNDQIIRNSGVAASGIVDDVDDFLRGTCIDIGADEFDTSTIPGTAYTWVGGVSNLWCEACNWDRDAVPPAGADVIIAANCLNYPLLQSGCGDQQVNNFSMQQGALPANSSKMDMGVYTLAVSGNVTINGTCSCTGVTNATVINEGLLDINSTSSQQILDIRNSAGSFPGELCKLRINKIQPTAIPSVNQEAILKGNLRILFQLDFTNGILLSQSGITYDANENTATNFKTITVLNDDPFAVSRQNIPAQNTRNGFFMGRLNRAIKAGTVFHQYLFPLGYRSSGGTGVVGDYFYTPALLAFSNVTNANFITATYLNNNSNFTVDGINIGFTGHGCFNPLEVDDQGGNTAVTCFNKEIDMMATNYWDFSESSGLVANGDPSLLPGALGTVSYDAECAGDVFALTALDGLSGSQLRLMNRSNVALPGNAGQGPWVSTIGVHSGLNISGNPGINMYSLGLLQGARRNNITQFGGFGGAGNGDSPLPIELLFFDAVKDIKGTVLCTWSTASEINSDYFVVEVATNYDQAGRLIFKSVGTVKASGNTTHTKNYSLTDFNNYSGVVYYRLLQVDFDGALSYSSVVAVKFDPSGDVFSIISFAPNPAKEYSELIIFSSEENSMEITLSDPSARIVFNNNYHLNIGYNKIKVFSEILPASGIYFMNIDCEKSSSAFKIIVP